jgi:hypothetical protein
MNNCNLEQEYTKPVLISLEREDVLSFLNYLMEYCVGKVQCRKQARDFDADRNRREWVRAGIYACSVALHGLKTVDEEKMNDRIEALETSLQVVTA